MASEQIDSYLASVDEPARSTLEALRRSVLDVLPDAEQGTSYGAPAFTVRGRTVAGFTASKHHLSYLPHSGSVLGELGDEIAGFQVTKGSLHFAPDKPLPDDLVRTLVAARMRELGLS